MGSGGSRLLCSPSKLVKTRRKRKGKRRKCIFRVNPVSFRPTSKLFQTRIPDKSTFAFHLSSCACLMEICMRFVLLFISLMPLTKRIGRYMVKPHGQLVHVSYAHYWTSTPCLSTSSSPTALQGTHGPSEISSWEGLPA